MKKRYPENLMKQGFLIFRDFVYIFFASCFKSFLINGLMGEGYPKQVVKLLERSVAISRVS